ncbi:MAG: hypothetical protein IPK83_24325 [Planctomycetes bacterium]|nr:hypothetical protein [Planctomycetota bacterium]
MSSRLISMSSVVMLAMVQLSVAQTPLGTEFTYQGQLIASGLPAISSADFQFGLFDAASGGAQIGAPQLQNNLALINGTFTTSLDFGAAAFSGDARWLEVAVRSPAGAGGFTTLSPRQALSATPNATFSRQTRGITVDADGQVGIGTTTPFKKLTVAGDMELGTAPGDPHHMRCAAAIMALAMDFSSADAAFLPFFHPQ